MSVGLGNSPAITAAIDAGMSFKQAEATQVAVQNTVLRKSLDMQASNAAILLQALPQAPGLATEGSVGTRVNTFA